MSDDHNITGKVSSRDESGASGAGFRPTINQNELDLLICLARSEAGQTTKGREPEGLGIAKKEERKMETNTYSVFLPHSHSLNLPTIFSLLLIASAGAPKAIKSHYRNIFIYAHLARLISIVSPPNTNLTSG